MKTLQLWAASHLFGMGVAAIRDLSIPIDILRSYRERCAIPDSATVLVVGAANDDAEILHGAGFHRLTLSNIHSTDVPLNAEDLALDDASHDMVFAHATLHHCRSPYKALAEMLRVSKRWVVFFEPNDSLAARYAIRLGLKQPYEFGAVTDNHNARGGVMDTEIPNFIHRWTPNELSKCARSAVPECRLAVYSYRYWDFNLTEHEIEISSSAWGRVVRMGQKMRGLLNMTAVFRSQGNHFFGAVEKRGYQPWIKEGRFDPEYLAQDAREKAANAA